MSIYLKKEHFIGEPSYIVFQSDDGLYYAVNQKTKDVLAKSADATAVIQAAINASPDYSRIVIKGDISLKVFKTDKVDPSGNKYLYFILIDKPIILDFVEGVVSIDSDVKPYDIRHTPAGEYSTSAFLLWESDFVRIRNLHLDGKNNVYRGIVGLSNEGTTVENAKITNIPRHPTTFFQMPGSEKPSAHIKISGCEFIGGWVDFGLGYHYTFEHSAIFNSPADVPALNIEAVTHMVVEDCWFENGASRAITVWSSIAEPSTHVKIDKVYINNFAGNGIEVLGTTHYTTICNSTIKKCSRGINVGTGMHYGKIIGVDIIDCQKEGIYGGMANYWIISNVYLKGNSKEADYTYSDIYWEGFAELNNILSDSSRVKYVVEDSDEARLLLNMVFARYKPIKLVSPDSKIISAWFNLKPYRNGGTATFSGDGTTTDFSIGAHGLAIEDPNKIVVKVTPISSDAITASPCVGYVDPVDNTKIRVKFASAPIAGTDNVKIIWEAQVV